VQFWLFNFCIQSISPYYEYGPPFTYTNRSLAIFFLIIFLFVERNNIKFSLAASLVAVIPFLTDYYYGYFSSLVLIIFIVYAIISKKIFKNSLFTNLNIINLISLTGLWIFLIIAASLPILTIISKSGISSIARSGEDIYKYTVSGWEYFIPL
jgi:hypothetical protein